jgi:hypothetical protein
MEIKLNHDEIAVCQILGRMRSLIARSANVYDAKLGSQDGAEADVMGMVGEYAFAKYFNVFPDLGLTPRSGSYDGKLSSGLRYDVKSTHYSFGRLIATLKENFDVDIYILAIVKKDYSSVNIVGYVEKKDFIDPKNIREVKGKKGYWMEQEDLKNIKFLKMKRVRGKGKLI